MSTALQRWFRWWRVWGVRRPMHWCRMVGLDILVPPHPTCAAFYVVRPDGTGGVGLVTNPADIDLLCRTPWKPPA